VPEVPDTGGRTPTGRRHVSPTAGLDGSGYRIAAQVALKPEVAGEVTVAPRVGWGFTGGHGLRRGRSDVRLDPRLRWLSGIDSIMDGAAACR
jgi:hypothetical protein